MTRDRLPSMNPRFCRRSRGVCTGFRHRTTAPIEDRVDSRVAGSPGKQADAGPTPCAMLRQSTWLRLTGDENRYDRSTERCSVLDSSQRRVTNAIWRTRAWKDRWPSSPDRPAESALPWRWAWPKPRPRRRIRHGRAPRTGPGHPDPGGSRRVRSATYAPGCPGRSSASPSHRPDRPGFGRLDILVNNAGIRIRNRPWSSRRPDDATVDTNLKGLFFCAQAAARP